jgi:hypothetical protein
MEQGLGSAMIRLNGESSTPEADISAEACGSLGAASAA